MSAGPEGVHPVTCCGTVSTLTLRSTSAKFITFPFKGKKEVSSQKKEHRLKNVNTRQEETQML